MNQSNYDNFNYDNYNTGKKGFVGAIARKMKNPIFATGAILLAGAALAGVLISSYPSGSEQDVPVVLAETTPFKELPSDPGGLDVPFQDSTVFSSLRDPYASDVQSIENLLDEEEPVDRLEAFAAEAERIIAETEARRDATDTDSLIEEATGVEAAARSEAGERLEAVVAKAEADKKAVEEAAARDVVAKIEVPEKPDTLYKPGSSPDTLEFVRDVLEKKDTKAEKPVIVAKLEPTQKVASAVADIKPGSGFDIRPGTHFVQLGSIKSAAASSSEWAKLVKKYPNELASAKYRVERADLGDKGVFFRIQAGPMAGESASEICGSIKAQNPGGCLVVK
ncbi:MAG: SPOR domain-containing protein [Bdellovibrionales bacterium]